MPVAFFSINNENHATTLQRPPIKLEYSLTGEESKRAIERGLAEADWYQCAVPRATMRKLLERGDGPALRDTILWFSLLIGFGVLTWHPSFKVYSCDVGLLGALARVPPDAVHSDMSILTEYQEAFVENHIAQHLAAMTDAPLHYWKNVGRDAEVDFLLQHGSEILPIEAKSGMNVRSKSLAFYLAKYDPSLAVRTSLRNLKIDGRVLNIPLYAFQSLPRFLALAAL